MQESKYQKYLKKILHSLKQHHCMVQLPVPLNMMDLNHSLDTKALLIVNLHLYYIRESFHKLHNKFKEWNHGEPLTENRASSKKMKRQNKMISIIRNSLKDEEKLNEFNSIIQMAFGLTQRKRAYVSDYGYQNVREVILGEQDKVNQRTKLG